MMVVGEIDEVFIPSPNDLVVNLAVRVTPMHASVVFFPNGFPAFSLIFLPSSYRSV